MVINVSFQQAGPANTEILKAYNSNIAATALEAYQPLNERQRKLEKLRALQILKRNSEAATLADISLETSALAKSLKQAEGATLQAMLNLLSAKMIEQNRYTIFNESQQSKIKERIKAKVEEKAQEEAKQDSQEQQAEDKQESKEDDNSLAINMEEYVDAVAAYIDQLKEQTVTFYSKILDTLSLKSIRKAFDESIAMLRKYAYDMPVEFIEENVVHPISSFPGKVKEYVDYQVNNIWTKTPDKSFSAEDIRDILNKALEAKVENNSKLEQTVMNMDRDLKAYSNTAKARLYQQGRSFTHDEVRLALHNL